MGLFNIFKKKQKFIDELFGELVYTTFKDQSKNFYYGTITFDAQQCGITIDADENGPTRKQKVFFKALCEKYPNLKKDVIIPFLNKELKGWTDDPPINDFDKEFELDCISLPIINEKHIQWTLTLYSTALKHYLTIEFTEWRINTGVVIDG